MKSCIENVFKFASFISKMYLKVSKVKVFMQIAIVSAVLYDFFMIIIACALFKHVSLTDFGVRLL